MQEALSGRLARRGKQPSFAEAWAALALRAVVETDVVPRLEWPPMAREPKTLPQVIAELLRQRTLSEDDDEDKSVRALAQRLVASLRERPKRARSLDEWYLGARALHGTSAWNAWQKAMVDDILRLQGRDGSWSERGKKGRAERVRATALAVLCLRLADTP